MTEPKPDTPLAPTRFIHPGADVTDGATGKPYSQAGEKSAGQLLYEKKMDEALGMLPEHRQAEGYLPWGEISAKAQKRWNFNATVTPKAQTIKAP